MERLLRIVVGHRPPRPRRLGRALGHPRSPASARSSPSPTRASSPSAPTSPSRRSTTPPSRTPTTPPRSSAWTSPASSTTSRSPAPSAPALTPANILALNQEEVDQLYARLTAGPIPDGPYLGDLFFSRGDSLRPRLEEILGGLRGPRRRREDRDGRSRRPRALEGQDVLPRQARAPELRRGLQRALQPDRRSRRAGKDHRPARGLAQAHPAHHRRLAALPRQAPLRPEPASTAAASPSSSTTPTTTRLPGYQENPDALVGRNGLRIRDEIRMIRPGFYLGRAYANKVFLLNFILVNEEVANAGQAGFANWRRGGRGLLARRTAPERQRRIGGWRRRAEACARGERA